MKLSEINNIINNVISEEIRKTIIMESNNKEVYHIKSDGEPIATFETEKEAQEALPQYKAKSTGELIIEKGMYESYEDMIDKLDEMSVELEEKENTNMKTEKPIDEKLVGKQKNIDKNDNGKIDAEDFKLLNKEEEDCNECGGMNENYDDPDYGYDEVMDAVDDLFEPGTEENDKLADAVSTAFNRGDIDTIDFTHSISGPSNAVKQIAKEIGLMGDDDNKDSFGDDYENLPDGEVNESPEMCSECGGEMKEGVCNECSGSMKNESKKKVLRLKESEMLSMINRIVKESVPGLEVTKRAQAQSKKDNEAYATDVAKKIKGATTFDGNDNPEFPKQIGKGEKVARKNTPEQEEEIADNRGGGLEDLSYDMEPSQQFKDRLKKSLEGHSSTGNSQEYGNVIKSDLGKNIAKKVERKHKQKENMVMYNKDVAPTSVVKESKSGLKNILSEEIEKMKKIANYDKKTQ
jgi:hypothetical protein